MALVLLLGACGGEAEPDAVVASRGFATPRNFVFISLDTLRADRLGCYGYDRETSPRIDAVASSSLRFANALAAANNTAPSHMSMFTGVYPPVHGQFNVDGSPQDAAKLLAFLPETIPLLAQRLSEAGFETLAFSDGGYVTPAFKFDRGFAEFHRNPEAVAAKVDRVLERLSRHDPARRLFLFVHTYAVHAPYAPPAEHDLWSDRAYDGPWRARVEEHRQRLQGNGVFNAEKFLPNRKGCSDADRAYLSDLYDGCIHYADTEIGRLLDVLTSPPWGNDTAILLVSDHGEAFDEHGDFGHRQLYREETEVPFILHIPGGPIGVSDAPVSGVDVAPTVLDVLGLEPLAIVDGTSVLQHIPDDRIRMSWFNNPSKGGGMMLLRGDAKLMRNRTAAPWERYDLLADPLEQNQLPNDDAQALKMAAAAEERLQRALELAGRLRQGVQTEEGSLSAETIESLKALGYLGDASGH